MAPSLPPPPTSATPTGGDVEARAEGDAWAGADLDRGFGHGVVAIGRELGQLGRRVLRRVLGAVSPLGWAVLVATIGCWQAARIWGWVEAACAAAGGLFVVVVAIAFTVGRLDLDAELELEPERLVAGESAAGAVRITNSSAHRRLPLRVELPVGDETAGFDVPSLAGGARFDEPFIVPTERRGVIDLGPITSVRGDPLGLVRREVRLTDRRRLYVHPVTVPSSTISSGWFRDLEGETTNDRSASDVAFHTLREYVPGDDRRHIHWRTTARRIDGKLMVREFVDTRRSHVAFVLSTRRDDYRSPDELELAISVVASLAGRAFADEQQVSCLTTSGPLACYSRARLFDDLAGVKAATGPVSLIDVARRASAEVVSASIVVVVCGGRVAPEQMRQAVACFGHDVRTLAVRADEREVSSLRGNGRTSYVEIGALEELPRLVWAVQGS